MMTIPSTLSQLPLICAHMHMALRVKRGGKSKVCGAFSNDFILTLLDRNGRKHHPSNRHHQRHHLGPHRPPGLAPTQEVTRKATQCALAIQACCSIEHHPSKRAKPRMRGLQGHIWDIAMRSFSHAPWRCGAGNFGR